MSNKRIVVIGGGHGQSLICQSIKSIDHLDISAIVTVADDGGSTGRLRELFHLPAMGDIRNVMLALSDSTSLLARLMDYRFASSPDDMEDMDVQGHNLGNLIFTALMQETGSLEESINALASILHTQGKVIPVTDQVVTLNAMMKDGTRVKGEKNIPTMVNSIDKVFYDISVYANTHAIEAILNADLIIYGIGSLYTSILPNVIIPEVADALHRCNAPKVYFCNAMTQPGETDGYSLEDHMEAFDKHHVPVDLVVLANDLIPNALTSKYLTQHSIAVKAKNKEHTYQVWQREMLQFDNQLVRHDVNKVKAIIKELLGKV